MNPQMDGSSTQPSLCAAEAAGRADGTRRPFVTVRNLAGLSASNSSEHIIPKSHQPENNMQRKMRTSHYENSEVLSASQVVRDGATCNSTASLGAIASAEHSLKPRPSAHSTESSMTAAASEAKETNAPSLKTRIQQ